MSLASGSRLGPYQVIAPLGAGGMGEVYKARDTRLGREVALKILPPHLVGDPDRRQRFLREARAASLLNHPNIITIYDIAETGGAHFIVMEYVAGRTLADRMAAGRLETAETLGLTRQIAAAMGKAHGAGITHRDLKPANIMITPEGVVKVLDFGLAKLEEPRGDEEATALGTQAGMIMGTAAYMSPEQASGKPVDARSDIFSFGLVLYEMLSGQRAFAGDNAITVMAAILHQEARPLREVAPQVPAELEDVTARCLRKDPAARFQSIFAVIQALEAPAAPPAIAAEAVPSIAVLPFANLSADKENEYFSDGLAEEIINALTHVKGLRVIARTSSFAFRGKEYELGEIGSRLKVGAILEGSVRKAGNRVRVTAQLINVADESHLWSERYDRELADVFAVQDEIARAVVDALEVRLTGARSSPPAPRHAINPEAYDCFLRGRFYSRRLTGQDMAAAIDLLQKAIEIDPGYAVAHAELGSFRQTMGFFGHICPRDLMGPAKSSIERALALDDTLAEAHAYLARHLFLYEFRWEEAERHFRRAMELNPGTSRPVHYYGFEFMSCLGRNEEGIRVGKRALELDPISPLNRFGMAWLYTSVGRYEEALREARLGLEADPKHWLSQSALAWAQINSGRLLEGVASLEQAVAMGPPKVWVNGSLVGAWVRVGKEKEAQQIRDDLVAFRGEHYVSATTLGVMEINLGNIDEGLRWLETSYEERDPTLPFLPKGIAAMPGFELEAIRTHPRWLALVRKMNLG